MNQKTVRIAALATLCAGVVTGCAHHRAVVVQEPARVVVVREPPPPAQVETPSAAPGAGYAWTAGYWQWNGQRYIWHPGQWVLVPRAGALWVEGHWAHQGQGWAWVPGHWQ